MFALLSPRLWLAGALAVMLAFSHLTAYRSGRGAVRTLWDKDIARRNVEALQASEAARAKEQAMTIANQKVSAKYAAEKKRSATAAANLAVSLRQLENTLAGPVSTDTATATVDHGTRGLERELLGTCAKTLAEMGITADRLENKVVALQDYIKSVVQVK